MNKRKLMGKLVVPVAFALLVQSALPLPLSAVDQTPARGLSMGGFGEKAMSESQDAPADGNILRSEKKITLEEAINLVKKHFKIPAAYTEFKSGYNWVNDRETWSLDWRDPKDNGGTFNAQVDVVSGEIIYMSSYAPRDGYLKGDTPKYSYEEAKVIAEKLVKSLLPERMNELQLEAESSQLVPVIGYGYNSHKVNWYRVVNGIPFPSNGVSVDVNAYDGTITGYSLKWSKESIPSPAKAIDKVKAQEVFTEKGLLERQYFLKPEVRILDSSAKDDEKSAKVIYKLSDESFGGMIDALTGEPFKLKAGEWLYTGFSELRGGFANDGVATKEELSPQEQAEVDETAKLITQEQAIASLKKWIEIPENLVLRYANLSFNNGLTPQRVWSLDWTSEDKSEYNSIYATVDAVTGEILHFNIYNSNDEQGKKSLTRAEAQKIAEDFLKKIQPNRFQQVKYSQLDNGQTYPENQRNHDFRYVRIVNDTPVPTNGFSVSVDSKTGKVTAYHMDFASVSFPSLAGTLTQAQGESAFLKGRPLELKYVQISKDGKLGEIRLVYEPKMDNNSKVSNMIDGTTGEFLDWQGKPIKEQPRPYTFNDIEGNFAEREIKLLGQAGAFGEYDDKFRPAENVTLGSLLRAMFIAKNGVYGVENMSDEELIKEAQKQGWLQEKLTTKDQLNRELLAKIIIRMLELEKVAQVEGMFQVPYEDAANFSEGSLGYIALVKGLGIMNVEGENFQPKEMVTRAEATYAIVKGLISR